MKLSKDYIDIIRYRIDQSDITMHTLKDDVLDHVCCVVEQKIKEGKPFEIALQEAFHELAPNGLDEIQRKTFYLLNSPKILFMKKVMYLTGLVCASTVSLGWLFVTLRWPGGRELFNIGFLAFLWVFVPMLAVDRYRVSHAKSCIRKNKNYARRCQWLHRWPFVSLQVAAFARGGYRTYCRYADVHFWISSDIFFQPV